MKQIPASCSGRACPPCFPQRKQNAFSLVEVMVVLTVIAILTALAVPSYQRALEQSRADIAAANLRAIWSAERLYWLENQTYTADLAGLQALGLLDPEIVLSATGYVYMVTSANSTAFTAVAVRAAGSHWSGELSVNETGLVSGALVAVGETSITPGFQ